MKFKKALLAATAATSMLAVLVGCSSNGDGSDANGGSDAANFGDCEVTSEAGIIELETEKEGVLTVATVLPNPGWWNGESPTAVKSGFEYCMAAEIANMAGLTSIEIKNLAWDQYISGTATGFDIAIASTTITEDRKEIFDFSAPYFESNLGIAIKAGTDVTEENLTSLEIGVLQGNMGAMYVAEELGLTPQVFQAQPDMFTALQANTSIKAVITDTTLALTATNGSNGALEVVGQIALDQGYGVVTPKGSANSAAVNEAVETMKSEGILDGLSEKWLKPFFGTDPNSIPFWTVD